MKRLAILILLLLAGTASAHVGSPDVFFEGSAGPYKLFVTVRMPKVIPGVAEIEIRSESPGVQDLTVVPMRLVGPGSELAPAADHATRSAADPQFFTASLWLMERGSLQVKIAATGARGPGTLAVPVAAASQTTLAMSRGLGALLFGLMLLLALSLVAIVAGALREAALDAGVAARARRPIAMLVTGALVVVAIALGDHWWTAVAHNYAQMSAKPWHVKTHRDGCTLVTDDLRDFPLMPDHGHDMHLFLVRMPALDRLAHLHPTRDSAGSYRQELPSLPAGHYRLYADVVMSGGYPITGTAELDLPDLHCAALAGDDSVWSGEPAHVVWDRPATLRAGVALPLAFHVEPADGLELYMGMVAHAEIMRRDGTVFAHLHPSGSVAMPALALAGSMQMPSAPSPQFTIPFGFPQPGDYRLFVQIKRAGAVETGVFDAHVE